MTEMSKDDIAVFSRMRGNKILKRLTVKDSNTPHSCDYRYKLNKIFSFSIILLLHLIKQQAEKRTTRSWEVSIRNSVRQIQRSNKRRKAKGNYLTSEEVQETLIDAYQSALDGAALEAFEGRYEAEELDRMVEKNTIIDQAMQLILAETL
jgi:hypothetical protein